MSQPKQYSDLSDLILDLMDGPFGIVVSLLFIGVGYFLSGSQADEAKRLAEIERNGLEVPAQIVEMQAKRKKKMGSSSHRPMRYYLTVTYSDSNGQEKKQEIKVSSDAYGDCQKGQKVLLKYLANSPSDLVLCDSTGKPYPSSSGSPNYYSILAYVIGIGGCFYWAFNMVRRN